MPKLIGTSSRKACNVSITNASTWVSANFCGKYFDAALKRSPDVSRMVQCVTSRPCSFDTGDKSLATEPAGYSFSQKGTNFNPAARVKGSTSGTPMKKIS